MANSSNYNLLNGNRLSLDPSLVPPRTPGSIGRCDAGDPDLCAFPGDTPRSLGLRDIGDPRDFYFVPPLMFERTEEYRVLESRVLAGHIRRQSRPPATEIPESELVVVEPDPNGKHKHDRKLRRAAAEQYLALMKQARLDLKSEKEEFLKKSKKEQVAEEKRLKALGLVAPIHVTHIGITSAYRSPKQDTELWHDKFREQFLLNYSEVQGYGFVQVRSGSKRHRRVTTTIVGPVDKMLGFIAHVKAAPGFSNHTNGIAVDFFSVEGGKRFAANTKLKGKALDKHNKQYERTWFYRWLEKHKDDYGVKREYKGEAWHWDFLSIKGDFPSNQADTLRRCV